MMFARRFALITAKAAAASAIIGTICASIIWLVAVPDRDPSLALHGNEVYRDGSPFSGVVYRFHTTGYPARIYLVWQGKRWGTERIWYDNGNLMLERPHRDGIPDGYWRQWYRDGKVKSLKQYKAGRVVGEVWGWHANGQVSDYNRYDQDGQELSHKSWIADGTPYYNYVYQNGRKVGLTGGRFCKRLNKIQRTP